MPRALPMPLLHPLASVSPRKHRLKHRTVLLVLCSLFTFTCYLLFISNPSLDLSKALLSHVQDHDPYGDQPSRPVPHRKIPQPVPPPRPQLSLSAAEELAALSAFIAALPHNVLPSTVDPTQPLDPQLVLDFDPRSESAKEELRQVVEEVWARFPVMLFTKLYSSDSREIRYMLSNMHLKPAPLVVEVDQREDAHVLPALLTRLTHVPSLPVLLIGGEAVGRDVEDAKSLMAEIRRLHENGELVRRVLGAGATVDTARRKGKGR